MTVIIDPSEHPKYLKANKNAAATPFFRKNSTTRYRTSKNIFFRKGKIFSLDLNPRILFVMSNMKSIASLLTLRDFKPAATFSNICLLAKFSF